MIVAVDSSAIFSILKSEAHYEKWLDMLVHHAATGVLKVCDVVAAELGAFYDSKRDLKSALLKLNLEFDPLSLDSCYLAGEMYRKYRTAGGKREFMLPDFLIAAHATLQADALLANDRGYLRRYFPKLKLITI